MIKMLAFALLGISSLASAGEAVSIPRVTPYAGGVGTDDVRNKCDWNAKLSENIARYAKGGVSITAVDSPQASGKVLTMKITQVHAIGGGSMSGSKWAQVHGEPHDGGTLVGSFVAERHTISGGWTACGVLHSLGKELGEDIAGWLKNPTLDANL